jgi:alkanesulfonate monooxygenase SsuD/methylene tetrahydromethanopterin reductase-like flavin-dependent oxidoreductase (luciferase family)
MRVHVVNVLRGTPEVKGQTLDRIAGLARTVEEKGFHGLWVTDSFGRGRPTLDPVVAMTGLGSGSTQADFDLVGEDYTQRFKSLMPALDTMKRAWRGERLEGGTLTPWPGTDGGPAVMLGAWRNKRWIVYAAEECQGWIASGLYPKPEELEAGIKFYRDAGGKRAILSNVIIDLHGNAEDMPLGGKASVMLTGGEAAARKTLQWIRDIGFDDVLCMARPDSLDDLARLRDSL